MDEINFNSNALVHEMMRTEGMAVSAKSALKSIGSYIRLYCLTRDKKGYIFQIYNTDIISNSIFLTLRLIKGSFHTTVWNTLARIDDEYALYYHENLEDLQNHLDKVDLLWSIKGVDSINAKISLGLIDWFLLRKVQASLNITCIGVLAFTKLLGRFLLSVPNYLKTHQYIAPMPATFMFNYLTVVCSCPLEVSFTSIQQFLLHGEDISSSNSNNVITNKELLRSFIQSNGSGAWIPGYLPVRQPSGRYQLLSKYSYLRHSTNSSTAPPSREARNIPTIPEYFQHTTVPASGATPSTGTGVGNYSDRSSEPSAAHWTQPQSSCDRSVECELLLAETAVRVVEVLPHPLGVRGLVAVLEVVHNQAWSSIQRFVTLDAYKVAHAILEAGHTPSPQCSSIELLDEEAWNSRNKASKQEQMSRSAEAPHLTATAALQAAVELITSATSTATTATQPKVTTATTEQLGEGTGNFPNRAPMHWGIGSGDFPSRTTTNFGVGTGDFQSPPAALRDDFPYSLPGSASIAQDSEYNDPNDFFLPDDEPMIISHFQPDDRDTGIPFRDTGNHSYNEESQYELQLQQGTSNTTTTAGTTIISPPPPAYKQSSIKLSHNEKYNSTNTTKSTLPSQYNTTGSTGMPINFNNTCEWGATNKIQKSNDFYQQLIPLLRS